MNKEFSLEEGETLVKYLEDDETPPLTELFTDELRRQAILMLKAAAPNGVVKDFIFDLPSGLEVGLTFDPDQKTCTAVFRGSSESMDWIVDFLLWKITLHHNVRVHYGFYHQLTDDDAYDRLVDGVKAIIDVCPDVSIYSIGHSLGGGLCTLFGYMLARDLPSKTVNVISFAAPRVGNYYFREACRSQPNLEITRVVNENDPITATYVRTATIALPAPPPARADDPLTTLPRPLLIVSPTPGPLCRAPQAQHQLLPRGVRGVHHDERASRRPGRHVQHVRVHALLEVRPVLAHVARVPAGAPRRGGRRLVTPRPGRRGEGEGAGGTAGRSGTGAGARRRGSVSTERNPYALGQRLSSPHPSSS